MSNGGMIGRRNVPGVDGFSGVWSLSEIANAERAGAWLIGALPQNGMLRWYEADSLSLADNDPVASWADQSAAADHAVQADSAKRPIFKAGVANGHAAVRFDGSNDWLTFAEILDTSGATAHVFVVAKANSSSEKILLSTRPSGVSSAGWVMAYGNNTTLKYYHTGMSPAAIVYSIPDQFNVMEIQRNGLTITLGANGSLGTPTSLTGYGASSANRTIIGATLDGTTLFFDSDIAEIIIYDHVLSTADRDAVINHLTGKYLP